jgi:hypothetical protein
MLAENRLVQTVVAALPVLLSPLLLFATAEGWLNFGGGEKDILLIVPYFIGTLTFFICAVVLIIKRWPVRRWLVRSTAVSVALLVGLGIVVYLGSGLEMP